MATHNELGKIGEELALKFLVENGYVVVAQNYYYKKAEIDIIAQKNEVLAVVEVKTRSTNYFGNPQDFVTPKKIKLLTMAVDHYVIKNNLDVDVRFDIIAITKEQEGFKIEHLEDAFLFL